MRLCGVGRDEAGPFLSPLMIFLSSQPKSRTCALAPEARRSQASPQIQFEATLPQQEGSFRTGRNASFVGLRARNEIAWSEIFHGDPGRIFPGLNNFHDWSIAGRVGLLPRIPRTLAPVGILPKIMPLEALARGEGEMLRSVRYLLHSRQRLSA